MRRYHRDVYDDLPTDASARCPTLLDLDDADAEHWPLTQRVRDPEGRLDWSLEGEVDVAASREAGRVTSNMITLRV